MDDNIIHTLVFFLDVLLPTKFSDEKKKKAPPKKKKTRAKKPLTEETTERLSDVDNNTITTNNKYTIDELYPYHVQYKDGSIPAYEPIELDNHFLQQFKLPYNSIPSVDLMCELNLPNKLINAIARRLTEYAQGRTQLPIEIPVDEKNPDG